VTDWNYTDASNDHETVSLVEDALRHGPVLYLPSWQAALDARRRDEPDGTTAAIERCRPQAENHLLALLVPAARLTGMRNRAFRRALSSYWQPTLVLTAKDAVKGTPPGFETAAIFLSPKTATWQPLQMFHVVQRDEPTTIVDEFSRLLQQPGGRVRNGYILRQPVAVEGGLGYDQHDPELLSRKADLTGFGALVPLSEVYEVRLGLNIAISEHALCAATDSQAIRVLQGRDIGRNGVITPADEWSKWVHVTEDYQLREDDLIMRAIDHPTDSGGFVVAEVTQDDLPAVAAHTVLVLRPRLATGQHQRRLTLLYLKTTLARRLATASQPSGVHVTASSLAELAVPQPDHALSQALDELDSAQHQFALWSAEAAELLNTVFRSDSAAKARQRLVQSGQQLRLRADAAKLIDDFGYTIRTRFPHPIALRWRIVEAALSGAVNVEAYNAVLDCAEVLLWYAANVALMMAYRAGIGMGAVNAIRTKLANGRSGPSLGDWIAVLEEVAEGKQFRRLVDGTGLGEFRLLLGDKTAAAARLRLTERRNDEAHMRRVEPVNLRAALSSAHADLSLLLNNAMFLVDMPLIVVHEARWDLYEDATTVSFGELMGDHAVVPSRTMRVSGSRIEQGSLYVLDRDRRPHLLRPYLMGRHCPQCGLWSTFGVDLWRNSQCVMKSLEHGHTVVVDGLADALRAVGLLS
jgi:hypothetical protein